MALPASSRLHRAIAKYLEQQAAGGGEHAEGFEVAAQLVRGSLAEHEEAESSARELLEIFIAGEAALSARAAPAAAPVAAPSQAEAAMPAPATSAAAPAPVPGRCVISRSGAAPVTAVTGEAPSRERPPEVVVYTVPPGDEPPIDAASYEEKLQKFVENLKSRGFFAGTVEGSDEYNQRYERARSNFHSKFGHRLQAAPAAAAATSTPSPAAPAAAAASAHAATSASAPSPAPATVRPVQGPARDPNDPGERHRGRDPAEIEAERRGQAMLAMAAEVALRNADWENCAHAATRAMDPSYPDLPSGKTARLLVVRAGAHLGLRDFDAAIADAETALALEPKGESAAAALLRLGKALEGQGKPAEAIQRGCASPAHAPYCGCAHAPRAGHGSSYEAERRSAEARRGTPQAALPLPLAPPPPLPGADTTR